MKKVFYSVPLVLIGLIIGLLIRSSSDGPLDCAKLPTREGVQICLKNLPREAKATPTPIPWDTTPDVLGSIKTSSTRVTADTYSGWTFSGVITNQGSNGIAKALYSLNFYAEGDQPKDHMPIARALVLIEGPIEPSKSLRFKVRAFSDKNFEFEDGKFPPKNSGALVSLLAVELKSEWVDVK